MLSPCFLYESYTTHTVYTNISRSVDISQTIVIVININLTFDLTSNESVISVWKEVRGDLSYTVSYFTK